MSSRIIITVPRRVSDGLSVSGHSQSLKLKCHFEDGIFEILRNSSAASCERQILYTLEGSQDL